MIFKRFSAVTAVLALLCCILCVLPVQAATEADLVVSGLDWAGGDGQVKPGTELTFSVTVANIGGAAARGPISVDLAFGTERITRLTYDGMLQPGFDVTLTSQPWTAVAGDKMISARVNPDNTVDESLQNNNTRQTNLRVATDRVTPAYNADVVTGAGMVDLTFNDDFDNLAGFDQSGTGREGYKWYIKRRWAQSDMTPADYSVTDGVLTLAYEDDTYTIGASTMDCETYNGYLFNKGYLEARVRITQPLYDTASKTAIWSLPRENWGEGLSHGRYVEMDWMEYFGESDSYGTTLHDIESTAGGKNWYSSSNGSNKHLNDAQWHVMGWLWEDNRLRCYIDGVPVFEQTWGPNDMPIPVHKVEEGDLQFEGVFEVMDRQNMMLFIAGSREMPMEFDYVRIWQRGELPEPEVTTTAATTTTTKARPVATSTTAKATTTTTKVAATTTQPTVLQPVVTTTEKRPTGTTVTAATTTQPTVSVTTDGGVTVTTASTVTTTTGASLQTQVPDSPFPWGLVLIPVAVLAAGGAVLVALRQRKKQ